MRTKVLLCAVALAASLASSMAQNVYSLNVVGYVNVTVPASQNAVIANPLDASMGGTITGGNQISNLFSTASGNIANGSQIYTYNPATANWNSPIKYSTLTSKWASTFNMPPGSACYYFNNSPTTPTVITFVGQVEQGPYAVATIPVGQNALLGSPIPIGGDITNSTTAVGLVPSNGDQLYTFNPATVNWNAPSKFSTLNHKWTVDYQIAPGQGFFYFNNSPTTANTWVSNFTVQ
jgi:hypothetical protein